MIVDLALAFLAGLLSFASTCVLPLVPAYVAYMGATTAGTETTTRQQFKVLGNAALFVAGFASGTHRKTRSMPQGRISRFTTSFAARACRST